MPVKMKLSDFIDRANLIHNFKYDYKKSEYVDCYTPITIECPKHGIFNQKPTKHLNAHGCLECAEESRANKRRSTLEHILKKFNEVHGSEYIYPKFIYKRQSQNIDIICKIHGIFNQKINNHISGNGCPRCNIHTPDYIFSKNIPEGEYLYCDLYVIKLYNDTESFLKVGISKKLKNRINLINRSGLNVDIIYIVPLNYREAIELELSLLRSNLPKYSTLTKFKGHTECFELDKCELIIDKIKHWLKTNHRSDLVGKILDYEYNK